MDIRCKRAYEEPSFNDGRATLVYGAKDEEHNNAVALRDYLLQRAETRAESE